MRRILLGLIATLALWAPATTGFSEQKVEVTERVEPRPHERCMVSGAEMREGDPVLIVKGRRVPVRAEAVDRFLANPDAYFSRVQPKSALFTEALTSPALWVGWFGFGVYVLLGLVFSAVTSYTAVDRGAPPLRWFLAGLLLNVGGLLWLNSAVPDTGARSAPAGLRKVPTTAAPVCCTGCGEELHPSARRCHRCGTERAATVESEASRALS